MKKRKNEHKQKSKHNANTSERIQVFTCKRCGVELNSKPELEQHHIQIHLMSIASEEIKLLEQGFIPSETKHGTPFKGKNKVVIA